MSSCSISAAQIDSGTFSSARIPNLSAGKITSGMLDIYNGTGFLRMGYAGSSWTDHPFVSALNVATQGSNYGGISFRNSQDRGSAGSEIGKISCSTAVQMQISSTGTINMSGASNVAITSAYSSSNYVRANTLYACDNGSYAWLAFKNSAANSPARIRSDGTNMCLYYGSGGAIYAGSTGDDYKVKTSGATPSSLNVKTNLQSLQNEYDILYEEMHDVEAYNFDYKYKNVNGDLTSDYGFIIDEIEGTEHLSKYFKSYPSQRAIDGDTLYHINDEDKEQQKLPKLDIRVWDTDSYIKGLFVMIKTLQHKIDSLEEQLKKEKTN